MSATFGLAHSSRAQGFEAVFLSVGVSRGRDLQIPGVELDGVVKAVDYLLNINRGFRMDLGRKVVVIGGGFVAFDAARTAAARRSRRGAADFAETDARVKEALDSARAAIRGGATEVTVVSLEDFAEMPVLRTTQGHEEFEEAKREGVRFITRRGPKQFLGTTRLGRVELRASDRSSTRPAALRRSTTTRSSICWRRTRAHSGDRPEADLSFLTDADGVGHAGDDPDRSRHAGDVGAGVYAGATSPSARAT